MCTQSCEIHRPCEWTECRNWTIARSCSCTCLAWAFVYRSWKKRKTKSPSRLCYALFFPLSLHRCFLPHLWCACVVCIFKVCKRRCLKKKMRAAMQLHAFPCDATLVHRGALSLDTNAEISCPHPLPSLTTSCNVIYKPSSSRVSLSFFFHSPLAHSRCSKNQRTPCVPFFCRVYVIIIFLTRRERFPAVQFSLLLACLR